MRTGSTICDEPDTSESRVQVKRATNDQSKKSAMRPASTFVPPYHMYMNVRLARYSEFSQGTDCMVPHAMHDGMLCCVAFCLALSCVASVQLAVSNKTPDRIAEVGCRSGNYFVSVMVQGMTVQVC